LTETIIDLFNRVRANKDSISILNENVAKRATEKLMGDYFERIVKNVNSKELDEKLHKFKMNDAGFTAADL
jgi:hypothetical protein